MTNDPHGIAQEFYARLEQAWNDADGAAFGAEFAPDSVFVDVRGDTHEGAVAIGAGHQRIFDTVYKGSTVRYDVRAARALDNSVVLAWGRSTLGGTRAATPRLGAPDAHVSV